jgi:phosphopantothenoylcysteine synthetase/decarboxylase
MTQKLTARKQGAEANWRITELGSLYKQHEEVIVKLTQENMSLELGIQSCNELVMEMATEMRLDRMGEDTNEDDDDDEGDSTEDTAATAPTAATSEVAAEEEEDPEMLILE